MKDRAFYLKVNREEEYAIRNLSRWIDVSYLLDSDCYVICDNEKLEKKIKKELLLYRDITFMRSKKDEKLAFIVNNIANRNWINTSYAHLTAIWHGCREYKCFWNIDADDTRFCVPLEKKQKILLAAEEYAKLNDIDCFSLDMWNSETYGKHWSFGVTFIKGQKKLIDICLKKCMDTGYKKMEKEGNSNVDWFFTYLKNEKLLNIQTFYVENLKFLHYSNDFFEKPIGSGLYHWIDGKLIYPVMQSGIGIKEEGVFAIQPDNVRLNVEVSDYETLSVMAYYTREGKDLQKYYNVSEIVNDDICQRKYEKFISKHGKDLCSGVNIVCFGAGNALEKNYSKINKIFPIEYVCDNDRQKWGKKIIADVMCISPNNLRKLKNIIVVILVYSKKIVKQISDQLDAMEIEHDTMDNFLRCVE